MDQREVPMQTTRVDAATVSDPVVRKVYAAPRLAVYGDIRVITHSMMTSGADGGTRGANTRSV